MEHLAALTRYRDFLRSFRDHLNMVAYNLENEIVLREQFDTIHYILDSMRLIEDQLLAKSQQSGTSDKSRSVWSHWLFLAPGGYSKLLPLCDCGTRSTRTSPKFPPEVCGGASLVIVRENVWHNRVLTINRVSSGFAPVAAVAPTSLPHGNWEETTSGIP